MSGGGMYGLNALKEVKVTSDFLDLREDFKKKHSKKSDIVTKGR